MKIVNATFIKSSQSIEDAPSPDMAEVVFLGRSNVGKSSLLNSLTCRKNLAKSSSTPGKTQLINHFEIDFKTKNQKFQARFVDLPGFGFARVSKSIKHQWHMHLTQFLEQRASIRVFVHLIDARHPQLDIDKSVDEFLKEFQKGDQILIRAFTKIDKLKQKEKNRLKSLYPQGVFLSNLKKTGIEQLEQKISEHLFGL